MIKYKCFSSKASYIRLATRQLKKIYIRLLLKKEDKIPVKAVIALKYSYIAKYLVNNVTCAYFYILNKLKILKNYSNILDSV